MNPRRTRSDDVLFLSAITAILLGVALLLYTTQVLAGASSFWPILVMAAGGVFLYLAFVRLASFSFLFAGVLFVLEGAYILVSILSGWMIAKAWPLGMAIAGLAWFVSGLLSKQRFKASITVPSVSFVFLGLVFSAFSFGWVQGGFLSFIAVWWPCLLIMGGILLFVAYGLSRRARSLSARSRRKGGRSPGS
jgi:hypothetical protein